MNDETNVNETEVEVTEVVGPAVEVTETETTEPEAAVEEKAEVVEETKEEEAVEPKGIEETADVVVFLAKIGVSISKCVIAGKFEFSEFLDDIQQVPAAISGISEVPAELKDIDSAEAKELLNLVLVELEPLGITTGEAAKHFVNAGFSFIDGITELVAGFKATKA